ncbi:MAG: 30S ribosomal protein S1 [Smithellaceae bacterium]|nr:30S ribosomal protein S1 [Smithellaceae bacterium]
MDQNNQNNEEKSFAELLAESEFKQERLKPGQKVEAQIVKIGPEWIFLNIGGKSEGHMDRKELQDAEGNVTVQEGETIVVYFLSSSKSEKLFTTKLVGGDATRAYLQEAQRNGIPVEGVVEKEVKGGFEIKIAGTVRGFCPFSQMGSGRSGTPTAELIGKKLLFKVLEYTERGRNIVVSNRAVVDEERKAQREQIMATLEEGTRVKGTIVAIQDFGAFVDIGGIQGLLPVSEVSWGRTEDIRERLSVGQEIEAVIKRVDREKDRISLSIKDTLPDPWANVEENYPSGTFRTGRVVKLTDYGAFVNLDPGVDGLIHISKLGGGKRLKHASEALQRGQEVEVKIDAVDKEKKRLSLSLAGGPVKEEEPKADQDFRGYIGKSSDSFGSLGDQLKDKLKDNNK